MKAKKKENSKVSLYLQFLLSIIVIVFIILYFIHHQNISLEFFLGSTLFVMGYNNNKFYQRKNMTVLYYVIGMILILFSIVQFFGV